MVTWEIVKKLAPWILATLVIGSLIWWVSHTSYVAMQPDSTDLLKRADAWLQNSQQLLDSVTTSSEQ